MRVFLNYHKEDKPYLQQFAAIARPYGISHIAATSATKDLSGLLSAAKDTKSDVILLSNPDTLNHCVAGTNPSLDAFRGSRLNFSVPAIVLNKLAHINMVPHGEWLLKQDLSKLQQIKQPIQQFKFDVVDSDLDFTEAYLILQDSEFIVFDVETTDTALMTSVQFSGYLPRGEWYNVVVPLIDFGVPHYDNDEEFKLALQFIKDVTALPVPKVAQGGNYDSQYLIKYRAPPMHWSLDTMIMWQSWHSELPKDLGFIASCCLYDYYQWKNELAEAKRNKDRMTYWTYGAKDTWYTGRVFLHLLANMPEWARSNYKVTFPKVFPALYANFEGFAVDWDKHKELLAESEQKLFLAEKNLKTMAADPTINLSSPKQVSDFLFNIIGAKRTKVRQGRTFVESNSTKESALNSIAAQHPLLARIVGDLLVYRKAAKAISTYFNFTPINDRVFWSILVGGTETNRFACHQSAFYGGLQVQNIPGIDSKSHINAKGFMKADDGFELIELDENKAEARCVAFLSQALLLIEALEDPDKDFYKILATIFFGLEYEDVSKDLRNNVVKRIIHGTNYMMQEDTFIETATPARLYEAAELLQYRILDLRSFAKYLLSLYHQKFPEVSTWYEEIKQEIATTGLLVSPLGFTREFFGNIVRTRRILRNAVAHAPQNLSVHCINEGFERIYYELVVPSKGDIRLKAQIHDSILVQVRLGLRDYYMKEAHRLTHFPVEVHGRTMTIPRDFKVGIYWDQMEEVKYVVPD